MKGLFEDTVLALCSDIAEGSSHDVADFVLRQWRRMPRFLAWPVWAATIVFSLCGLFAGGLFHRLPRERRKPIVDRWRRSAIAPVRDLIRFYRSLAILAQFSFQAPGGESR